MQDGMHLALSVLLQSSRAWAPQLSVCSRNQLVALARAWCLVVQDACVAGGMPGVVSPSFWEDEAECLLRLLCVPVIVLPTGQG